MNNFITKAICITLTLSTAVLSATLTTQFMFSIGEEMGSPELMAALGLTLDLAKCSIPAFAVILFRNRKWLSGTFALLMSIVLSTISFGASVAALENGVLASKQNSISYKRIASQVDSYNAQILDLRTQAEAQRSVRQITASKETLLRIAPLQTKIDTLLAEQSKVASGDTVVTKYGMIISYVTAASLELLSWLLVSVSSVLFPVKHNKTQLSTEKHKATQEVAQVIENTNEHTETQTFAALVGAEENTFEEGETENANTKNRQQVYLEIRDALLAKTVRPSHTGITEAYKGVSREVKTKVLSELGEMGFLVRNGRGWTYA